MPQKPGEIRRFSPRGFESFQAEKNREKTLNFVRRYAKENGAALSAAPHEATIQLLRGHADIVQIHICQITESILMIIEVDANGLPFIRGQIIGHLRPRLRIRTHLHDLRQRRARSVLHLGLLPVVGDSVGGRRPVPERQRNLRRRARNGDGLIQEVIPIRLAARTRSIQGAVGAGVLPHRRNRRCSGASECPVGKSPGFKPAILDQLRRGSGDRQRD